MPSPPTTDQSWPTRLCWTLVGVALISWSLQIDNYATDFGWAVAVALLCGFWGVLTVAASWIPQLATPRALARANLFAWLTAILTVTAFAVYVVLNIHQTPAYGTDELAFDQYAGELVRRGLNPYTHSLAPALSMFSVSPFGETYTFAGARVTEQSYPALSFLVYVPFLALGWSRQLGNGLDVIGWALSTLMIFKLLPRDLRPVALILGSAVVYVDLTIIGLTDMVFMPLLVLAAYRWDRFGNGWRTYLGPVALGLAMSAKQTPWPILPFILIALALDERDRTDLRTGARRAGRYLAAAAVAFLVPNLPYILASPSAWAQGIFTPFFKSLVPAGQGVIAFSLFLHVGGGSLVAFSVLMALVFILLLVAYLGTYPLLRAATFALPAIAYFFALRCFADYLVALVPAGLVAAVTVAPQAPGAPGRLTRSRGWTFGIAGAGGLCLLVALYAAVVRPPLALRITGVQTPKGSLAAQQIELRVTNRSTATQKPGFALETKSGVSTFWHIVRGPASLAPHASATYTIVSANTASQFSVAGGITVLGFLTGPDSVSVSNSYKPDLWHIGFDPQSVDQLVPLGQTIVIRTRLLNDWDTPVAKAGVAVTLTQAGAGGKRIASIDGNPPGRRATAYTDAGGVASFRIVGQATSAKPLQLGVSLPTARRAGAKAIPPAVLELRFAAR